MLEIVHKVSRV